MFKKSCLNLILLVLAFVFFAKPTWAATFSLSPATGSYSVGNNFSVLVKLDTQGQPINTVDVFMSFPTDLLQVVSVSQSTTFRTAAEKSVQGGGIHMSLAAVNPDNGQLTVANGNVTVATVTFKPKAIGSAAVSIGSNSVALSHTDGSNKITSTKGGTFNIILATPKPSSAATQSTQAIIISNLKATAVATDGATITWKTDKKSDSLVDYGLDKEHYVGQLTKSESVLEHSLKVTNSALLPGSIMHFRAISEDSAGLTGSSEDTTVHLKGYKVKIMLVDNTDKPLGNTKLTIYSDPTNGVTDAQGNVNFVDMSPEKHVVVIHGDGFERSSDITVAMVPDFDTVQTFKVVVDAAGLNQLAKDQNSKLFGLDYIVWAGIVGVVVLGLIILFIYIKKKESNPPSSSGKEPPYTPTASNPNADGSNAPVVYSNK